MKHILLTLIFVSALLSAFAQINISGTVTNASCYSSCNGSISATVSGGIPPYNYYWSHDGSNSPSAGNLCPGTYILYVYDAQQNNTQDTFVVTGAAGSLKIDSAVIFAVGCRSSAQTINIYGSGGVSPFNLRVALPGSPVSYAYALGISTPFTDIYTAGIYSPILYFIVDDATGCSDTVLPTSVYYRVNLNVGVVPPNCGSSNGVINVSPSTGTPPFTYAWNTGATSSTLNNLSEGNYSVTVTDANGCKRHRNFELSNFNCRSVVNGNTYFTLSGCNNNGGIPNLRIKMMPDNIATFSGVGGAYSFTDVPTGSFTLSMPDVTPACPLTNSIALSASPGATLNNNHFYIPYNAPCADAGLYLDVRQDSVFGTYQDLYTVEVSNTSTNGATVSGTAFLNLDANLVVNTSAITPGYSGTPNNLNWSYTLAPFERVRFSAVARPLAGLPPNTHAPISASIVPNGFDCYSSNNQDAQIQVINIVTLPPSFRIRSIPRFYFTVADTFITYRIGFQNTRKDTVFHVEIRDTLDSNLDGTTLQLVSSSHAMKTTIKDDKYVAFNFNNIYLPDSTVDWANSHGFVEFKVKPKNNLPLGTEIKNRASVYLDYNTPLLTGEVTNIVSNPSSNEEPEVLDLKLFPNPAKEEFYIESQEKIKELSVYSTTGQLLIMRLINFNACRVDVTTLSSGLYMIIIEHVNGQKSIHRFNKL